MNRKIFFRADGNSQIGLGHIYRCSAVAQMVSSESICFLVISNINESLRNEMLKYFSEIIITGNKSELTWINKLLKEDIVVLDGYHFDDSYQLNIKPVCKKLVCIDDIYNSHFHADIIINHAGGVDGSLYDTEPYTRLYLGPSYAMVRSVFWNKPSIAERLNDHVFVCLGGADPKNDLVKIIKILIEKDSGLKYHVVTGSAYRYENALKDLINNRGFIFHYKNLDAPAMKELMQKCAIAVVAPSTVSYEYLSIGGELYLYPIAENQKSIYKHFVEEKLALPFEAFTVNDSVLVSKMLKKQDKVFDGKSYARIKEIIING
jgi:UDP-2,4-diacetamido-2,4,6-trideoxy-beta-L-altropyranose hydrolase